MWYRTKEIITREVARAKHDTIFVFGDNLYRYGLGGQAKELRGEPNCIGVVTKYAPNNDYSSFFRDRYTDQIKQHIRKDLNNVIAAYIERKSQGQPVHVCFLPLGTGLAKMHIYAPKTLEWLNITIDSLIEKYNAE